MFIFVKFKKKKPIQAFLFSKQFSRGSLITRSVLKFCHLEKWNNYLTFQSLPVALRTTSFNIQKFCMVIAMRFMCFEWLSEQTITFALYIINSLVFITEVESVYSAVRTESVYNTDTSPAARVNS